MTNHHQLGLALPLYSELIHCAAILMYCGNSEETVQDTMAAEQEGLRWLLCLRQHQRIQLARIPSRIDRLYQMNMSCLGFMLN